MAVVSRGADRPYPPAGMDGAVWDALLDAWDRAPVLVSVLVGPDQVVGVVSHAADVMAETRLERGSQRSELLADIADRVNATGARQVKLATFDVPVSSS